MCAVQARSLTQFWGILLRKMMWPTPPKRMDEEVISQLQPLSVQEGLAVLRVIATQTASVVMLARYWHDQTKADRRALEEEWEAIEEGLAARTEEAAGD